MTQLQAIRIFTSSVLQQNIIISRQKMCDNWGMNVLSRNPRLSIPSNLNYKPVNEDIQFYNDFISRYHDAKYFKEITLVLLHECGHWMTKENIDWADDIIRRESAHTMYHYMRIPSEWQATEWAINWLKNKQHRILARQFEKNFFGKGE